MTPQAAFKPRVTPFIIGLNLAVFATMAVRGVSLASPRSSQLLEYGANFGALVVGEGQWWRPLTSMFVHIGAVHVLFNMYALWNVGGFIERLLGRPMFFVVYLLTGLGGSFCSILWSPFTISAGASGAIFGLFGVLTGFTFRARDRLPPETFQSLRSSIFTTLVFNLLFALSTQYLDHAAHLGGFAVGLLAGVVATASALESDRQKPAWASLLIVLATVAGLGVLADTRTKHLSPKLITSELALKRAEAALEAQDWADAVKHATESLSLRDTPEGHLVRGLAELQLGEFEPALEDLRKGPSSPNSKDRIFLAYAMRGEAAMKSKEWGAAVSALTEALQIKGAPELYAERGLAHMHLGEYERAVEDLRRGPGDARTKNNLAWALVRLNRDLDKALEQANAAVAEKKHAAYLGTRCWVHVARGDLKQGRPDCEAAVKTADHDDLMDKGMLKFIDGDQAAALELWELAAKDPVNARDLEPWIARVRPPDAETTPAPETETD